MAPNPIPVVNNDLTGKTNYFWDNIEDQFSQQGTLPRSKPWQFNVKGSGAIGDNVTDDTTAIKKTIAAAFAYANANTGYAEIVFDPNSVYFLAASPDTSQNGNAVLALPLQPATSKKITLVFNGGWDATALYHWQQTTVQTNGAVLRPGYAASSTPTVGNEPSVLGGPTPTNGYGSTALFNNMNVVVYGIQLLLPVDPHICGFDFRGMAEAQVPNASVLASTTGNPGNMAAATQAWQFGLYMPEPNNNDLSEVGNFSCEGSNYGLVVSEHTHVISARIIYCIAGMCCAGGNSSTPHWLVVDAVSIEACQIGVQFAYDAGAPIKVIIREVDFEGAGGNWATFHLINDPNNVGVGEINFVSNGSQASPVTTNFITGTGQALNGCTGLKITSSATPFGTITAPTFPLTTVALMNGSGRDAAVTITNGAAALTIAVDGVTQGVIPVSGVTTFMVPANKSITPTYASGTPSWKWTLL